MTYGKRNEKSITVWERSGPRPIPCWSCPMWPTGSAEVTHYRVRGRPRVIEHTQLYLAMVWKEWHLLILWALDESRRFVKFYLWSKDPKKEIHIFWKVTIVIPDNVVLNNGNWCVFTLCLTSCMFTAFWATAFSLVLEAVQLPHLWASPPAEFPCFLHSVLIPNMCDHCRPQKCFALGIQRQESSQRKEGI